MVRYSIGIALFGLVFLVACQPGQTPVTGRQVEVPGGAYTEISVGELQSMLENKDFVLVDRMSTIASETLVGLDYTNIYNLDGGMVEWKNADFDLER